MNINDVLVVCIGNICRSPMAEAVLRQALADMPDIAVTSAGIGALEGYPADEHAVALMHERGLDISRHKARQLTAELIGTADLILVMEAGHKRAIGLLDPTARGKVHRLCEWRQKDIPDPYQQPRQAFENALSLIDQGVADWAEKIRQAEVMRI
jgi:protein-tyrosine phosphatase